MANPIVHVEIPAKNPKESSEFYAHVFGWKPNVAEEFNYYMFQAEGGPGGGFTQVSDDPNSPGGVVKPGDVLIYLGTDDIEASLAEIEAHGGKTLVPKMEIPNTGWFAIFADPAGNRIALYKDMSQG
jgi:predicted enzyme related to lactoylglutathione lyase